MKTRDDAKVKSWILLFAGLSGIAYQQYTGKVNWVLLLIFTSMTGVPGLATIISLIKNSPTVLQLPFSPSESSESDSEKLSQKSLEDEK